MNSNSVILIPKNNSADKIEDYMPIALANFQFKIITKVLADRLATISPKIISQQQRGFIKDRKIQDCICLASEAINLLERKTFSGNMAIKLYLKKAFDTMDWDFLLNTLQEFGFNPQFITWIKVILQSSRHSFNVNGQNPLLNGWVKVNTDGAAHGSSGLARGGGIFRDQSGNFLGGFAIYMGIQLAIYAEFQCALIAVELAYKKGDFASNPISSPSSAAPILNSSLRQFILVVLRSNCAERFITNDEIPSQFLTETDCVQGRVNPAFLTWEEQDQMLIFWILNSLSAELQPRVVGCCTSRHLWLELVDYCQAQTKARARQLRSQLKSITKGSSTISEYFILIKGLVDALVSIGSPISHVEHVDFVLDGLSEDFQTVITAIESQNELPTINALQSFLLTFEARLDRKKNRSISYALSVNIVAASPFNSSGALFFAFTPRADGFRTFPRGSGSITNFRGGTRGRYRGGSNGFRGSRGSCGRFSTKSGYFCIFCYRFGHDVSLCYYAPSNFGAPYSLVHEPYFPGGYHTPLNTFMPYQHYNHSPTIPPYMDPNFPSNSQSPYALAQSQSTYSCFPFGTIVAPQQSAHPHAMTAFTANASASRPSNSLWYPNSGATHHLTEDVALVHEPIEKFSTDQICIGNGADICIKASGSSKFYSSTNPQVVFTVNNLLFVPSITKNLLSVPQFSKDNLCYFQFYANHCLVKCQGSNQVLLKGFLTPEGLYAFTDLQPLHSSKPSVVHVSSYFPCNSNNIVMHKSKNNVSSPIVVPSSCSSYFLCYCRLGHAHQKVVSHVLNTCNVSHMNKTILDFCTACSLGKSHKLHAPAFTHVYVIPFELLYLDLWGPAPMDSNSGFRYYLSIVDAATRHTWFFLLKAKADIIHVFTYFLKMVKTQFAHPVKSVQSDWGGEFRPFTNLLQSMGIVHRLTCPHTHHQNGTVERKYKHIVETGLSLLAHACLLMYFWDHAFLTVVFLINRLPSLSLSNKTPHFLMFGTHLDYLSLKVFGCSCFPHLRPYNTHKLEFRSSECTFLGYSTTHKGYKCLTKEGKMIVFKDVVFNEYSFPYASISKSVSLTSTPNIDHSLSLVLISFQSPSCHTRCSNIHATFTHLPTVIPAVEGGLDTSKTPIDVSSDVLINDSSSSNTSQTQAPPTNSSAHAMQTRSKCGIFKPKVFLTQIEPSSSKIALTILVWKTVMQEEFDALINLGTWSLTTLLPGKQAIGCKWVFRVKQNPDGSINRYKARLVAKGFHQKLGVDYT
ncbi:PREDICTED: uncharacterized protein LOC109330855 [Lupinus angustifolius]|uniref:uncharacterized protein LOC109330855 n=1 Tax=Lupinus angustifolius TaxID=3871 RepID=UPI00092FC99F|nr:PREDICTED: uncharacterized protein LOC109330855 [Lupinus angustifolius]